MKLTRGEHFYIRRAHYLLPTDGLPCERSSSPPRRRRRQAAQMRDVTGRTGTVFRPVRELPKPGPRRKKGTPIPIRRVIDTTDVTLTA
ncbi:hypothetical protein JK359_33695 [Streptomyces actinomycinicus]|uniref:Uncharacterized protein n=1 Tax=Streptomyces actinomycinicus TaxID=1695166 RepID=A0A937JSK7_9ACTN|nr:hypothetical protein [Streptomyces actinomycinicus]MBL1086862.1 hypothetical protein [Streptomyces actinomycinicus]